MSISYIKPLANKQKRLRDLVEKLNNTYRQTLVNNICAEAAKTCWNLRIKLKKKQIQNMDAALTQAVGGSLKLHIPALSASNLTQEVEIRSIGEFRAKLLNIHADAEIRALFAEHSKIINQMNTYITETIKAVFKFDEDNGEINVELIEVNSDSDDSWLTVLLFKSGENIINDLRNQIHYLQGQNT